MIGSAQPIDTEEARRKPLGEEAPRTPPSPPQRSRHQEGKGKTKGKSKRAGKAEIEEARKKKKNKGRKRGVWWQSYIESRAARRSQQEENAEIPEEVIESEENEGNTEAEAAISERLNRWADATEETGP